MFVAKVLFIVLVLSFILSFLVGVGALTFFDNNKKIESILNPVVSILTLSGIGTFIMGGVLVFLLIFK